jgi:hypothetical protein
LRVYYTCDAVLTSTAVLSSCCVAMVNTDLIFNDADMLGHRARSYKNRSGHIRKSGCRLNESCGETWVGHRDSKCSLGRLAWVICNGTRKSNCVRSDLVVGAAVDLELSSRRVQVESCQCFWSANRSVSCSVSFWACVWIAARIG